MEIALAHILALVGGVFLSVHHVVTEGLTKWPVHDNEKTLSTRLCSILPLDLHLSSVEQVQSSTLPLNGMPLSNLRIFAEKVGNMLIQQILLLGFVASLRSRAFASAAVCAGG